MEQQSLCAQLLKPAHSRACLPQLQGFPWWLRWCRIHPKCWRPGFNPWVGKIPRRRKWQPTPVFWPGESHGQRSLADYIYSVAKESDTTGRLNNNPLPLTPKPQHLCWLPSPNDTGMKGHVSSLCPTHLRALPQMAALHNWAGGDPPDHQCCLHTGLILPLHHLLVPPLIQMLGTY